MNTYSMLKRVAKSLGAVSLFAGLIVVPSAVSVRVIAATGPMYPTADIAVSDDDDTGEVVIKDGQTVRVEVSADINYVSTVWDTNPETFSASQFGVASVGSGVTTGTTTHRWSASSNTNMTCSAYEAGSTTTSTLSIAALACKDDINYLSYELNVEFTNATGSDKTITMDFVGNELLADGSVVADSSSFMSAYQIKELDANGAVIPDNATGTILLSYTGLCFATSVQMNDELDIENVVKLGDPTPVDLPIWTYDGPPPSPPYYTISGSGDLDGSTFTVTTTGYFNALVVINASITNIGDTVIASLDLTDSGESVLSDDCGGGGGGPSLTQPEIASGAGSLTNGRTAGKGKWSTPKNLPAGFPVASLMHASTPGPLGDVFYYGPDSSGDAVIVRLKKTGAAKIGGGTTKLTIDLAAGETIGSFGWYGAAKNKYVLITRISGMGMSTSYKAYLGNLTNTKDRKSKTIAATELAAANGMCGSSNTVYTNLRVLSAPTAAPMVAAFCALPMGRFLQRIGKLNVGTGSAATITSYASFTATDDSPCVYTSYGVNEAAKGSKRALVIYSATGEGGAGMCSGTGITGRKLITVTTSGAPTAKTISSAVFGSTEPGSLVIVPGKASNSWLVVAYSPDSMMAPGGPSKMYTISATGGVAAKASVTLGSSQTIFVAAGGTVQDDLIPIKQLNNGKWMVIRIQHNGTNDTKSIALATVNPQNGAFTYGEGIKFTSYQRNAGAYIDRHTIAPNGEMSYYFSNEAGKFRVATWKSFTS